MGGNKISASGVSSKWVKSNRHRKREERREKFSDYNGQYLSPEPKLYQEQELNHAID